MPDRKVIGLVGAAGVGKSAVARELVQHHGYQLLSLAEPLKYMLAVLLMGWGYNDAAVRYWINGDGKEKSCPALQGQSPRLAMQLMGTEYGRQGLGEYIWIDHLVRRIKALPEDARIVVDDVRFDNEANALAVRLGASIIQVVPAKGNNPRRRPPAHVSENGVNSALIDHVVENDFTFEGVSESVRSLAAQGVLA